MPFGFSLILIVAFEVKQKSNAFYPDLMYYVKFYSIHLESDVLHRIPVVSLVIYLKFSIKKNSYIFN